MTFENSAIPSAAPLPATTRDFLSTVAPFPAAGEEGFVNIHRLVPGRKGLPGKSCRTVEQALKEVARLRSQKVNIYFCTSRQRVKDARLRDNATVLWSLFVDADIDPNNPKAFPSKAGALADILRFCDQLGIPRPSFIVFTGGGLHVYWCSDRDLPVEEWQPYADGLKAAMQNTGLKVKDIGLTTDAARVLRVPGTLNFKYDPPREVRLLKYATGERYDFSKALAPLLEIAPAGGGKVIHGLFGGQKVAPAFSHLPLPSLDEKIENFPAPSLDANKAGSGTGAATACENTFWRKVNEMALAKLPLWVPEIFGDEAIFQKSTGAYRISSKVLKRDLEEDLSIHPKGITDWGTDDQGKPGEKAGRYTAIHIVIEHGGAPTPAAAALWLCERCGVDPASLGWKRGGAGGGSPEIERLAAMSWVDYEKARKKAAKELGFRVSVLDDLVGQMREEEQKEETTDKIAQLNAEYALVLAGNKAAVMKFDEPTKFRLLQTSAFTMWFANQLVTVGKEVVSLGQYWLAHAGRRQYAGIEFAPPGSVLHPNFYNLWQGFTCEPVKGDCSKFMAHLKANGANGDHDTFLWQFGWWAQIFQHPSTKMGTSLVFRGPFGAGKTKIGEVFGSLIGEHYQPVSRAGHITGNFNSHMAALLVLHADEAFWAGSKETVGVLRDLVTGTQHLLEYKGVDKIRIRNFIRLFVTGNPDWMVPAGFKERRWAIFDIGEDKMQDSAYFAAIDEEMNNGGREALLHELLNFDLSQVNLRVIPKTAALLDQQIESMDDEQAWWFEALMGGMLPSRPRGVEEERVVLKSDLYETYILHAKLQGISRRSIETKIGRFLTKQLGARLTYPKPLIGTGERVKQIKCYKLPPLKECRELFVKALGQPVAWGDGWETEEWRQSDDWKGRWSLFD